MAFTPSSGSIDPKFTREMLTGENNLSLKKLSRPYEPPRDGINQPYDLEDLLHLYNKGNKHGWGISSYTETGHYYSRSANSAHNKDRAFDRAVENVIRQNPSVVLSHVRLDPQFRYDKTIVDQKSPLEIISQKSADRPEFDVREVNSHPFVHGKWSFMHNGLFDKSAIRDIVKSSEMNHIKGSTDSELFFYSFLYRLKKAFGTTDPEKLSIKQKRKIFAQSINDVIKNSKPTAFELDYNPMGVKGYLNNPPKLNFVLSDGENLFIYRKFHNLFLGVKELPKGEKEYIIASEHTQSGKSKDKNDKTKWLRIPQNHILTIARNKNTGKRSPVLMPLHMALDND